MLSLIGSAVDRLMTWSQCLVRILHCAVRAPVLFPMERDGGVPLTRRRRPKCKLPRMWVGEVLTHRPATYTRTMVPTAGELRESDTV